MGKRFLGGAALFGIALVAWSLLRGELSGEPGAVATAPADVRRDAPVVELLPEEPPAPALATTAVSSVARATSAALMNAPGSSGAEPLAWDELERDPPPYPWPAPEPPADDVRAVFEARAVSLEFNETPLLAAIEYLNLSGLPRILVDPAARARIAESAPTVTLRLRNVRAVNALNLILACDDVFTFFVEPRGVRVGTRDEPVEAKVEPEHPPAPFAARLRDALESGPHNNRWRDDLIRALDGKRFSFNFDATPLNEAMQFFADLSGVPVAVSKSIDGDQVRVTLKGRDRLLRDALNDVMEQTGLNWKVTNPAIVIMPDHFDEDDDVPRLQLQGQSPDPSPGLRDQLVSVDLRGVNVSEAIAALESQGIPAFASERAWRSRGTFSVVARNEPLGKVLRSMGKLLEVWIAWDPRNADHEVVLIDGALASMRDALHAPVPPVPDFVAEMATERQLLVPLLRERRALRDDPAVDRGDLVAKEFEADDAARELLDTLEHRKRVAFAPERLATLEAQLALEDAALRSESDEAIRAARSLRVAAIADQIDKTERDVAALPR